MTKTSNVMIAAGWQKPVASPEERRERVLDFFSRIRGLHPLLNDWAPFPKRGGDKVALKQPSIFTMDQLTWREAFAPAPSDMQFFHHHWIWNRILDRDLRVVSTTTFYDGSYPVAYPKGSQKLDVSSWVMSDLPQSLIDGSILSAIFDAAIVAFGADQAELGESIHLESESQPSTGIYDPTGVERDMSERELAERHGGERYSVIYNNFDTPLWRLWLRDGKSWPEPGIRGGTHLQLWQCDEPYECEPWLSGKLYTWPQFKPQ